MSHVAVILNRSVESRKSWASVAPLFERRDDVQIIRTNSVEEGMTAATEQSNAGARMVFAAGGDGSIQAIARGLVRAEGRAALALAPAGRGNDLARALGVPRRPDQIEAMLDRPKLVPLDVGVAVVDGQEHEFVNALGMGFDGAVAARARAIKLPGLATYSLATLSCMVRRVGPWHFSARGDGLELDEACFMLTIGNSSSTGGGFRLTPDADPSDGLLDYCVLPRCSRLKMLWMASRALKARHDEFENVRFGRFRELRATIEPGVPVHADGEVLSNSARSVVVSLRPAALDVAIGSL